MNNFSIVSHKIISIEEFSFLRKRWKFNGDRVVFTNGCFDIIHQGHIDYLTKAADLGNRLVIGLNSDESVKTLDKGPSRPLQNEHSRALILASLHFVDAVILFDEHTPEELITKVEPEVLCKGGDYTVDQIAGADFVKSNGGEVVIIPFLEGYSTTAIEQKIKGS